MIILETPVEAEVQHDLECLVTVLAGHSNVSAAILFGSSALGTRRESSDIDLLVLTDPSLSTDEASLIKSLRLETFGKLNLPLDLIVEDARRFEERRLLPTLERKISREGKVIYES